MADNVDVENEKKVCDSCGIAFGCGANSDGCWCTELTLTESQAANIQAKFTDCLCPTCLQKFAVRSGIKITYPDGSTEIVENAVRIDTQNFHEGMFDLYDERGDLLRQISMSAGIKWDMIGTSEKAADIN